MKIDSNDAKQVDIMISKKIEKNNGISIFLLLAHLTYLTQRLIYSNQTHMDIQMCAYACTHTNSHARIHKSTHKCMHLRTHVCTYAQAVTCDTAHTLYKNNINDLITCISYLSYSTFYYLR